MSYMSAEERDKILQDITRTSHRDLDDELRRRHVEIKDEFIKEQNKYRKTSRNRKLI
jgi:hypothetical protein